MNNEAVFSSNLDVTRSLTAILFTRATNLGFSASAEQSNVIGTLQRDFRVMRQCCRQYRGQVIKSIGESLLMTFSSGSNAVTCALEIQKQLSRLSQENPNHPNLQHSIGVHLGEVFLSDADIMGNEVNIAMQLQAEVPAGGLCISQPLYEVVKLSTPLYVAALGERPLKGTTTPLALYQVLPEKPSEERLAENVPPPPIALAPALSCPIAPPPARSLSEIAQALEGHSSTDRIKRLLLFTCRETWESNPTTLSQISMEAILQEVQERFSTFESLHVGLKKSVTRLNKPTEYATCLKVILNEVRSLYNFSYPSLSSLMEQIAQDLEHRSGINRIKKLLIWATRERWETDSKTLRNTSLIHVLPELLDRAANPIQLQVLLNRATQTLNKSAEYQAISEDLCQILTPVYEQLQELETEGSSIQQLPNLLAAAQSPSALGSSVEPIVSSSLPVESPPVLSGLNGAPLPSPQAVQDPPMEEDNSIPEQPVTACRFPKQISSEQCLNLRFNLVQRTNPLRLKALLYSILYEPISFRDRSWLVLQQYFLDQLLIQVIERFTSLEELGQALHTLATEQAAAEEYLQTVEILLQVLKSELKLKSLSSS